MKTPVFSASGYGMFMKDDGGKYVFTEFDENGNDLARKLLEFTTKVEDMKIVVRGNKGPAIIQVESIAEVE